VEKENSPWGKLGNHPRKNCGFDWKDFGVDGNGEKI